MMVQKIALVLSCLLAAFCAARAKAAVKTANMNGKYVLSDPKTGKYVEKAFTDFDSYPRPTEYFDVYSPKISTLYSQVYWTRMDKVELPADIVKGLTEKPWL